MPTLADFQAALDRGDNLILLGDKPFILVGIRPERPANPLEIEAFSGTKYKTRLENAKVVGRVDRSQLRGGTEDAVAEPKAGRSSMPWNLVLADGFAKPGDRVKLANGQEAIYTGLSPRRPKNPVDITINGKSFKCAKAMVKAVVQAAPVEAGR